MHPHYCLKSDFAVPRNRICQPDRVKNLARLPAEPGSFNMYRVDIRSFTVGKIRISYHFANEPYIMSAVAAAQTRYHEMTEGVGTLSNLGLVPDFWL
jgi:hypothetical protein